MEARQSADSYVKDTKRTLSLLDSSEIFDDIPQQDLMSDVNSEVFLSFDEGINPLNKDEQEFNDNYRFEIGRLSPVSTISSNFSHISESGYDEYFQGRSRKMGNFNINTDEARPSFGLLIRSPQNTLAEKTDYVSVTSDKSFPRSNNTETSKSLSATSTLERGSDKSGSLNSKPLAEQNKLPTMPLVNLQPLKVVKKHSKSAPKETIKKTTQMPSHVVKSILDDDDRQQSVCKGAFLTSTRNFLYFPVAEVGQVLQKAVTLMNMSKWTKLIADISIIFPGGSNPFFVQDADGTCFKELTLEFDPREKRDIIVVFKPVSATQFTRFLNVKVKTASRHLKRQDFLIPLYGCGG